jgi:hypothetical protein
MVSHGGGGEDGSVRRSRSRTRRAHSESEKVWRKQRRRRALASLRPARVGRPNTLSQLPLVHLLLAVRGKTKRQSKLKVADLTRGGQLPSKIVAWGRDDERGRR